jgi:hypothetical protein
MAVRLERRYQVRLGPRNQIVLAIGARQDGPLAPLLIYAGGEHAVLRRNAGDEVVLDYLHPEVRPYLKGSSAVSVLETGGRDYLVPVGLVESLPAEILGMIPKR